MATKKPAAKPAAKAPKKTKIKSFDFLADRHAKQMNQNEYWRQVGVTQSGGSRYESGRKPSLPVRALLRMIHGGITDPHQAVELARAD